MLRRVARPLLAATFIANGVDALLHPKPKVEAAKPLLDRAQTLVPAAASVDPVRFVQADGVVKIGAGLMMALGRAPRISAALLAVDLIPSTAAEHPFWSGSYPADRKAQQTQFLKNAGLLGGLLFAITAPGRKKKAKAKKGPKASERAREAATSVIQSVRPTG